MDPLADWEQPYDWTKRIFRVVKLIGSRKSLPLSKQIVLDAKTQLLGRVNHICNTLLVNQPCIRMIPG